MNLKEKFKNASYEKKAAILCGGIGTALSATGAFMMANDAPFAASFSVMVCGITAIINGVHMYQQGKTYEILNEINERDAMRSQIHKNLETLDITALSHTDQKASGLQNHNPHEPS